MPQRLESRGVVRGRSRGLAGKVSKRSKARAKCEVLGPHAKYHLNVAEALIPGNSSRVHIFAGFFPNA